MIDSYVRNLFSKATRLGVSYTEHLFLTLRVVRGKLSNRSLKTKEMNYSKELQLKNKDNHFQESEQNSPSSSVLSRRSQPDTFVRSFSTNFTALAGKALIPSHQPLVNSLESFGLMGKEFDKYKVSFLVLHGSPLFIRPLLHLLGRLYQV